MSISRRSLLKGLCGLGAATAVGTSSKADAREPKQPGPDDVAMLYDSTLCIGCRACVTKCKESNELPADKVVMDGAPYDAPMDLSETTKNIIKLYDGPEGKAFVKMQCMHCVDPACVSVCMAGALHKKENGVVAYDKDVCVGCRYCQVACPFDVPKFNWLSATPLIVKCEMCSHDDKGPACCQACPREAVIYGKRTDLLAVAKGRMAASPDKYLPTIYGEHDGGGLNVMYLTHADISFDKLGLPLLPSEPMPQMSETIQHSLYYGFIAPAALYGALTIAQFRNRKANAKKEKAAAGTKTAEPEEKGGDA